eukprot:2054680-Prymnesium_polylepis.3
MDLRVEGHRLRHVAECGPKAGVRIVVVQHGHIVDAIRELLPNVVQVRIRARGKPNPGRDVLEVPVDVVTELREHVDDEARRLACARAVPVRVRQVGKRDETVAHLEGGGVAHATSQHLVPRHVHFPYPCTLNLLVPSNRQLKERDLRHHGYLTDHVARFRRCERVRRALERVDSSHVRVERARVEEGRQLVEQRVVGRVGEPKVDLGDVWPRVLGQRAALAAWEQDVDATRPQHAHRLVRGTFRAVVVDDHVDRYVRLRVDDVLDLVVHDDVGAKRFHVGNAGPARRRHNAGRMVRVLRQLHDVGPRTARAGCDENGQVVAFRRPRRTRLQQ